MPKMTMVQALNLALRQEMEKDDSVIVLGEDVGVDGGVFRVTDFRNAKWSAKIGRLQPTLPVTLAIGGTSSAWKIMPTAFFSSTPSSCCRKSRCQKSRRSSPSVIDSSPAAS